MRKRFTLIGLGVITTFLLISLPAGRHGDVYPQASRSSSGAGDSQTISRNTFIQIAQKVSPSVVNVFNFIEYGAFKTRVKASLGTGFIIDSKKGLVLLYRLLKLGQVDENQVAQLLGGEISDADGSRRAIHHSPFVRLRII